MKIINGYGGGLMQINLEKMEKIHDVQLAMWKELKLVLEKLGLNYFFVHGSLLGAVEYHEFIAEDDDIDIALFRKDYNVLMAEGNKLLPSRYFLQSSETDDFPLAFGKIRDCETAFIQPILERCKCNKGIYIDIFPIDFCPNHKWQYKAYRLFETLLQERCCSVLQNSQKASIKKRSISVLSKALFPQRDNAIQARYRFYSSRKESKYVSVTNGKSREQYIPAGWFAGNCKMEFCGELVSSPIGYKDYLKVIYGQEYQTHNPAESRIGLNQNVEISASILDLEKSYKYYEQER